MNDELLKMLPMSEIDADIHSSVPGYWQQTIRRCIRLLEKRHKYDKPELSWYFKWGFGHNHFWVSDLNGVRLIFVEF